MSKEKLEFQIKEKKERFCMIDGITFPYPEDLGDYLVIGVYSVLLLITLPIWIIPYLIARLIVFASTKKKEVTQYRQYICPVCNSDKVKGYYKGKKCNICDWKVYEDYY